MTNGNNLLQATSVSPTALVSQQLSATDTALYTVAASTSIRVTQGTICNISNALTTTLTKGTTSTSGGTLAANTYYWVVSAVSAGGESLASNEVSATTTGSTSSQPLTWTAVAGASKYYIYRGTAAGAEGTQYSTTGTSFTDTGAAGSAVSPQTTSSYGQPILVYLSIIKSGGSIDLTHRILQAYSLDVNNTLALSPYVYNTMLGPSDVISGWASITNSVDIVLTGVLNS